MTQGNRSARITLPAIIFVMIAGAWEAVVRLKQIPPYILPSPSLIAQTLIQDWPVLFESLLTTLRTTLEGFIAAATGGIALALLFSR